MPRGLHLVAVSILTVIFSYPAAAQDSPSLGDVARQAQKDREKDRASKPTARVLTNDDLPSGGGAASALGGGSASDAQSPMAKVAQLEKVVDLVDSLDQPTLVANVLQEKKNVNFADRAQWEQRLMAAKRTYVSQLRALIQRVKQIAVSADGMKGPTDPNDPRVKEMGAKLESLARDAVQTDSAFQAVMMEGRDLASQATAH